MSVFYCKDPLQAAYLQHPECKYNVYCITHLCLFSLFGEFPACRAHGAAQLDGVGPSAACMSASTAVYTDIHGPWCLLPS